MTNNMLIRCLLITLLTTSVAAVNSAAPIWNGNTTAFKGGVFTLITSGSVKTGSMTITLPSAYASGVPKLLLGTYRIDCAAGAVLDYTISAATASKTASALGISYTVGSSTVINALKVSYLTIDKNNNAMTVYNDAPFHGIAFAAMPNINSTSTSGPRSASAVINFTSTSGGVMDISHAIKVIVFIQGLTMQRNTGDFDVNIEGVFLNSSFYTLTTYTSGNTTITKLFYSRVIFDQTDLQESQLEFVDSGIVTATASTWSQLSLSFIYRLTSNFLMGFTAVAFGGSVPFSFEADQTLLTSSGTMTFNTLKYGYWNYRLRTCPGCCPYYNLTANTCVDDCGPYNYVNTTRMACALCQYSCYSCSNITITTCLSCSPTDFRALSGTTCPCNTGYYDNGVSSVCVACSYTCETCIAGTSCVTCLGTNFRTLTSGQCPCDAGYIDIGVALCASCSATMPGCTTCASTSVCSVCDVANNFIISGSSCACQTGYYRSGSTCLQCNNTISGCNVCSSGPACSSCNSTAHFSLSGTICICASGYYLSGTTCSACTVMSGCLTCSSGAVCTSCNATALFSLSSGSCHCSAGYYPNGAVCSNCNVMNRCTVCTSSSVCTTCNATSHWTASGTACGCQTGYYQSGASCLSCSAIASCLACSSNVFCTSCSSPFTASSGSCVCSASYYLSGTTCASCSSAMVGCLSCTTGSNCLTCDTAHHFTVNGTKCSCASGYYLNGTSCLACMTGCSICTNAVSCSTCDAAAHYVVSGAVCGCDLLGGYVSVSGACQLCSILIPGCTQCTTSTACTACYSPFVSLTPLGGSCTCPTPTQSYNPVTQLCQACSSCCPTGQYYEIGTPGSCQSCSSLQANCQACTAAGCTLCSSGYFVNGNDCDSCTITEGCLTCSSNSVCTGCDASSHFELSGTTCVCHTGYTKVAANCQTCSQTMPGCITCSSVSQCTSCDLSSNFQTNSTNSSACQCLPGYYLSGGSCHVCTMNGCLECSTLATCTSCNTALHFTLSSGNCDCANGYYLDAGTTCLSCSSAIPGCLVCPDGSSCSSCDTADHYQLSIFGTSCDCVTGYWLNAGACVPCGTGCLDCDSTGTCTTCDATDHFDLVSGSCSCLTGYYLSAGACLYCDSIFDMCVQCTAAGCLACNANASPFGTGCKCDVGYYNTSVACDICSNQIPGCAQCVPGACTLCDSAQFFTLSGTTCVCASGHTFVSGTCPACSSLINGCSTCSSSTICLTCDNTNHFTVSSGKCICMAGFYMDAGQNCVNCTSMMTGCNGCTSASYCTSCIAANSFVLNTTSHQCECPANWALVGSVCVDCMTACTCTGYRWVGGVVGGTCAPFCSDALAIFPEECDDGNLLSGDGCSPTCQAQPNYSCVVNLMLSMCSYSAPFTVELTNMTKDPTKNQLTFAFTIGPALADLNSVDFAELIQSSFPLGTPTWTYADGQLLVSYPFSSTLQGQQGTFTLNPTLSSKFYASAPTTVNFTINPTNNLPAVYYEDATFGDVKRMDQAFRAAVYASYGVFAVGLLTDKVIGVELMGVLQLAYLSVSNLNFVQPLLSPLMNLSIVNGYNMELMSRPTSNLPNRIREIGYSEDFLNNVNVMFGLVLAVVAVAGMIYAVGAFYEAGKEKLHSVAKRMLKQYLMMLVTFNIYNVAYSFGLQMIYGDNNSTAMNIAICAVALLFPIGMSIAIHVTSPAEYGEFLSHYKNSLLCKSYFPITILYRMVLGVCTSALNEYEDMTIVNVFVGILYVLYLGGNLPYRKAYHNYRAIVVQVTGVVILVITMYYRSMRSFTPPDTVFRIVAPAYLEIILIGACIGVSTGCLAYELYLKVKSMLAKKVVPSELPTQSTTDSKPKSQTLRADTELGFGQTSKNPMDDSTAPVLYL